MPNWIGDFVMATPVLEGLKEKFPKSQITVICRGQTGELLHKHPHIDEIVTIDSGKRFAPKTTEGKDLISELRKGGFDLGVVLPRSFSTAWVFSWGGVKEVIGFSGRGRWFLLSSSVKYPKEGEHLVETYQRLTKTNFSPKLFIPPKKKEIGKCLIGVNPGAAYGQAKCWLPDRFRAVIEQLLEIPGIEIRVYGDQNGKEVADVICAGFDHRVVNLAGKTSLYELTQEISALDVLLTNDSGPMHIAQALEVPLVALFGSTSSETTGPYKWGQVIHKRVECSPCYLRQCPIDFRCMKGIEVDEVVKTIKRQLLVKPLKNLSPPFVFKKGKEVLHREAEELFLPHEVGVVVLAGGAGRRLGGDLPKGCLEIGGKSLYERFWEKKQGEMAFLTSPATHRETERHFLEKGITGEMIPIRSLPRFTPIYEESPEGNGGLFEALYRSGILARWQHLKKIVVVPIDNPLIDPYYPQLLSKEEELVVLAIEKKSAEESVGVLVEKEGRLFVCEYFALPEGEKKKWKLAYAGVFAAQNDFFKRAAASSLPWHEVKRNDKKHLERFAPDAFCLAKSYRVSLIDREKFFHPIKTKQDIEPLSKIL